MGDTVVINMYHYVTVYEMVSLRASLISSGASEKAASNYIDEIVAHNLIRIEHEVDLDTGEVVKLMAS